MQYIVRWGRDLFPLLLEEFKVIKQIGVIRRFSRLSNLLLLVPVKKKNYYSYSIFLMKVLLEWIYEMGLFSAHWVRL